VGVDLGVSSLATLSTGEIVTGPKAHKALLCRLQRLSRGLSRKVKGSENRKKAKAKLARLHARIGNIRQDGLHQLTTDLTRRFHIISIEDLNVRGMVKNRHLSRAVSDMSFFEKSGGEFHRVSLWRGRLWPWAQAQDETGLCEAGIQQQSCLWVALRRYGRTVSTTLWD